MGFGWINWGGPLGMNQGVSILAAELAEAGHDVRVFHYHEKMPGPQNTTDMALEMAAWQPDVAMFSFGTNQAVVTRQIVDGFKRMRPQTPTIGGGVHCTLTPEEPLEWGSMDYVFIGEADGRMDEIVRLLADGRDISNVFNIGTLRDGNLHRAPIAPLPDVTKQHHPYWEGIDFRELASKMRGIVEVLASRGCPFRCTYCHNAGLIDLYQEQTGQTIKQLGFLRVRDPHEFLAEKIRYREICGDELKYFMWGDDMAVMSKPFLREWARIYPPEFPDVPFALNATLNYLDEETVQLLSDGGCNLVKFGLESGSARLRKLMRRPDYKEKMIVEVVERLRRYGINSRAYLIVGYPTETKEELLYTFELSAKLGLDTVRPSIFFPYPGTPSYAYCVENDLIDHEKLASVLNYYSCTVLNGFDEEMEILISRIMDIFPILMNSHLGGDVAEAYKPLADRALNAPEELWSSGIREEVLDRQQVLNRRFLASKAEFYSVPFPDRPDACFLMRPRVRPLPNVDDVPNREIVAV